MAPTVAAVASVAPRQRLETVRPVMAKAIQKMEDERRRVGKALKRAVEIVGLNDNEASALIGVDNSQFGRWLRGEENVNLARVYATKLHGPFAIEMARDADGCTVETTVTFRAVR